MRRHFDPVAVAWASGALWIVLATIKSFRVARGDVAIARSILTADQLGSLSLYLASSLALSIVMAVAILAYQMAVRTEGPRFARWTLLLLSGCAFVILAWSAPWILLASAAVTPLLHWLELLSEWGLFRSMRLWFVDGEWRRLGTLTRRLRVAREKLALLTAHHQRNLRNSSLLAAFDSPHAMDLDEDAKGIDEIRRDIEALERIERQRRARARSANEHGARFLLVAQALTLIAASLVPILSPEPWNPTEKISTEDGASVVGAVFQSDDWVYVLQREPLTFLGIKSSEIETRTLCHPKRTTWVPTLASWLEGGPRPTVPHCDD